MQSSELSRSLDATSKRHHEDDYRHKDSNDDDAYSGRKHHHHHHRNKKHKSKKDDREHDRESGKKDSKNRHKNSKKYQSESEKQHAEELVQSLGYSNIDNPFGDSNLSESFVWKKRDKVKRDRPSERSHEEKLAEIVDLRKRKDEYEISRLKRQEERDAEIRLKEKAAYTEWEHREKDFFETQCKNRSRIRIIEKRKRPIDMIANNILMLEEKENPNLASKVHDASVLIGDRSSFEYLSPYQIIENIQSESDLYTLKDHVEDFQSHDTVNKAFWGLVKSCVVARMDTMKESAKQGLQSDLDIQIRQKVSEEISGKSLEELKTLCRDIDTKISRADSSANRSYWRKVFRGVDMEICKKELDAHHNKVLNRAGLKPLPLPSTGPDMQPRTSSKERGSFSEDSNPTLSNSNIAFDEKSSEYNVPDMSRQEEYNITQVRKSAGVESTGDRNQDQEPKTSSRSKSTTTKLNLADIHLRDDEELLGKLDEVEVTSMLSKQEGTRTHKPDYIGIIRTGVIWNKYNSTHYDKDNPPPKSILSYRFTIFYPDLVDKKFTPKFKTFPMASSEFVTLQFSAGPPYNDIAFRIVNKPWDSSRKHGYQCSFEKGILQLNFQFQTISYRR